MSRKRNTGWSLFIFLLIASLTLVAGDSRKWWDDIRDFVETKIVARRVNRRESEPEKLSHLESKIISLEENNKLLEDENKSLRKQLEAPLPASFRFIPGYVISLENAGDEAVVKVAAGGRDGVVAGMPVISESTLVGIVNHVTPRMSTVLLLSSTTSKIAVKTSTGARGLIVGVDEKLRPDNAILDRVLQNESVVKGDRIVTSGEDELPANLLVGEVGETLSESRDPFKRASVSLFVKPNDLKRVFIVGE